MVAFVLNSTFVILFNISNKLSFCGSNSTTTQSPKTLGVILRHPDFIRHFWSDNNATFLITILLFIYNQFTGLIYVNCELFILSENHNLFDFQSFFVSINLNFHKKNYAQHYIGKSRADVLKPTEVHLFNFCSDIGSSTSIPCLRQYFAVSGNTKHSAS